VRVGGGGLVRCGGGGAMNVPVAVPPAAGHQMSSRASGGRRGAGGGRRGVAQLSPPCGAVNVCMAAGAKGGGNRDGGACAGRE